MANIKEGDRVKRADADDPRSIPAYRDMRGTVVGFAGDYVLVDWDCDANMTRSLRTSRHRAQDLALAEGG